jgi:hypothetical protein
MKAADSSNLSGKTRGTQKSLIAAIATQAAGLLIAAFYKL